MRSSGNGPHTGIQKSTAVSDQRGVHAVVEQSVRRRTVHDHLPVRQEGEAVEGDGGRDRPSQAVHDGVDPSAPDHEAREPLGGGEQHHWGHHEGDDDVLRHVHEVEVLLADVVHRPVGRPPQQHDAEREPAPLRPGDRWRPGRHDLRSDHPSGVGVQRHEPHDEHPNLRMRNKPPKVRRRDHDAAAGRGVRGAEAPAGAPCQGGAGSAGPDQRCSAPKAHRIAPRSSPQASDEELIPRGGTGGSRRSRTGTW